MSKSLGYNGGIPQPCGSGLSARFREQLSEVQEVIHRFET